MSVTVIGVPYLLLRFVAPALIVSVSTIIEASRTETLKNISTSKMTFSCESIEELQEQEFDTEIMDKETLLKTLNEHGAQSVWEENSNIICHCEGFEMTFYKNDVSDSYKLNIKYSPKTSPNGLIEDISEEYNKNVQEVSYNKIKQRLEEKNLTIDEEEILDDDTIVLTVNLE